MAINFDQLLVLPGQNIFSQPLTITPTVSQSATLNHPVVPYAGRGVWSSTIEAVTLEDGSKLTTRTLSISIRLSEYAVPPQQGDTVSLVSDTTSFFAGIAIGTTVSFVIDDLFFKGDGSVLIILKRVI
jgi:hypothetical protein